MIHVYIYIQHIRPGWGLTDVILPPSKKSFGQPLVLVPQVPSVLPSGPPWPKWHNPVTSWQQACSCRPKFGMWIKPMEVIWELSIRRCLKKPKYSMDVARYGPIFWHCEWTIYNLFLGSYCKRLGWGNLRMSAAVWFFFRSVFDSLSWADQKPFWTFIWNLEFVFSGNKHWIRSSKTTIFWVFQLLWRCQLFARGSAWNEEMIGELMVNFRNKHIGNHEPTMIPTMIRPPWIAHLPLEFSHFSRCVKCC